MLSGFVTSTFQRTWHNLAHWIIGLQKLNTAFRMILFAFYPIMINSANKEESNVRCLTSVEQAPPGLGIVHLFRWL